ncbi:CoA transferase [Pseudonocardia sp. 73-21]|uniref:CoA transferase n=1 Tax=Pseudonocardia sp. 73-21 TaxID=1895809 RepID=UPI002602F786|nr:CoA transferase [Pseudonocardia sp. 73-21]
MNASEAVPPALDGVRVIDLTTTFMGPYATMLMAWMGADVVKVEAPNGDVVRHIGRGRHPGMGPIFLSVNHGKRSIALDLKRPEARDALHRLLEGADVFVTNLRPAALAGLGLITDELLAAHPRLVYASLPGFRRWWPVPGATPTQGWKMRYSRRCDTAAIMPDRWHRWSASGAMFWNPTVSGHSRMEQ